MWHTRKTHESTLILDVEPIYVFMALGMLDLEPGMNLEVEGDPRQPKGAHVEIWVEWKQGDKDISRPARDLVWNMINGQPMQKTHWVFTEDAYQ